MFKGDEAFGLGTGRVTLLRGKGLGIELVFAGRDFDDAFEELEARLGEQPGFYRGTTALVNFGMTCPSSNQLQHLQSFLHEAGIELRSVCGSREVAELAAACSVAFEEPPPEPAELERRRALRPRGEVRLSDSARSLAADFAGARADIAERRRRGEPSVPRIDPVTVPPPAAPPPIAAAALHLVETPPGTLYHTGTLRGGQALHHTGNIVVVGDVNPGAELVATGDILVFGRLSGVAHAGAQGDAGARVYALDLAATQLRIATFIATDAPAAPGAPKRPEAALVHDGRIVVAPFDTVDQLQERGACTS